MAEFEKILNQMKADEEYLRRGNEELILASEQKRKLEEEREKRELPQEVFQAHTVFKNDIAPILDVLEESYLKEKAHLEVASSIFKGDHDQWMSGWEGHSIYDAPWPYRYFQWQCDKGDYTHALRFELRGTYLNIEIADNSMGIGSREQLKNITKDIDYVNDTRVYCVGNEWKTELEEKIVKLLKYPEITHVNHYSGRDSNDTGLR